MKKYTQPVKVGDEIELEICSLGEKGDGIGRHDNFVVMVPDTEIGNKYLVKIKKVFEKFALSEKMEEI